MTDALTVSKAPADVARMFDALAAGYDRTNAVLSLGLDRTWRRATAAALATGPDQRVLDVAAGTGASSRAIARTGAWVAGCDLSLGMLRRAGRPVGVAMLAGDGLRLPFADAAFDRVTISFGLRNVADVGAALRELLRVTRAGGRLVVCEFSRPANPLVRALYTDYLVRALPRVARLVASSPASYGYLVESIRAWPDQRELADLLADAGWAEVGWRNLTGGIVALHRAVRPG